MLEFQQDNQFFLFNLTEKPTEPASFFESAFWEKQQRITGSAKGRGTTYFLNTKDLFGGKYSPSSLLSRWFMGKIQQRSLSFSII